MGTNAGEQTMKIVWHSVTSSNIERLGLAADGRLVATFKGGRSYIYSGDHSSNLQRLLTENQLHESNPGDERYSVGALFNSLIKKGGYVYSVLEV